MESDPITHFIMTPHCSVLLSIKKSINYCSNRTDNLKQDQFESTRKISPEIEMSKGYK